MCTVEFFEGLHSESCVYSFYTRSRNEAYMHNALNQHSASSHKAKKFMCFRFLSVSKHLRCVPKTVVKPSEVFFVVFSFFEVPMKKLFF